MLWPAGLWFHQQCVWSFKPVSLGDHWPESVYTAWLNTSKHCKYQCLNICMKLFARPPNYVHRTWQCLGEVITQLSEQEVVAWLLLVIGITDYQLCILNQSEGCILNQSAHYIFNQISVFDFQCSCTSVLQRDSNVVKSKFNRIHQKYTVLLTPLLALFGHGFIRGQRNSTGHVSTKCFAWYLWMVIHAKCRQLFLDQILMWSICYPAFMSVFNGACSNPISMHCSHAYVWHVHCVCMVALSCKLRFTW